MKSKTSIKILTGITSFLFFTISCGQNTQATIKKNDMLPKEIKLSPKTTKIIDSIFTFKDGVQKLETVNVFDVKNGLLTHANNKYFVNDTLNLTTNNKFNSNGNSIESKTTLHLKDSYKTFRKELDNHENITLLATEDNGIISYIEYKNIYRNNLLSETSAVSQTSGKTFDKTNFEYDDHGNLVKEKFAESENVYEYNQDNKITLYKHITKGVVDERIIYHYNNKLLSKMEWYESISPNPMITEYFYNDKNQLISEVQKQFAGKTQYRNYNTDNNWQIKEQYSGGQMDRLTKRTYK